MKARVIATGDIVDVHRLCASSQGDIWQKKSGREYFAYELDFDVKEPPKPRYNPDYWTRLEHQAAIAAMRGMLSGWWSKSIAKIAKSDGAHFDIIVHKANELAHALVEKMKQEREG